MLPIVIAAMGTLAALGADSASVRAMDTGGTRVDPKKGLAAEIAEALAMIDDCYTSVKASESIPISVRQTIGDVRTMLDSALLEARGQGLASEWWYPNLAAQVDNLGRWTVRYDREEDHERDPATAMTWFWSAMVAGLETWKSLDPSAPTTYREFAALRDGTPKKGLREITEAEAGTKAVVWIDDSVSREGLEESGFITANPEIRPESDGSYHGVRIAFGDSADAATVQGVLVRGIVGWMIALELKEPDTWLWMVVDSIATNGDGADYDEHIGNDREGYLAFEGRPIALDGIEPIKHVSVRVGFNRIKTIVVV